MLVAEAEEQEDAGVERQVPGMDPPALLRRLVLGRGLTAGAYVEGDLRAGTYRLHENERYGVILSTLSAGPIALQSAAGTIRFRKVQIRAV